MKKHRNAKQFLEELRKTPVVTAVCKQLDISRQTIFRWCKEDPAFNKEYEECLSQGISNINDLAISQVITKIKQGDNGMTKYWLSHNHERYMKKHQEIVEADHVFSNPKEKRIDFLDVGEAMLMKKLKQGNLDAIKYALQYNSGRYHPMKAEAPFLDMTDLSDPAVVHILKAQMDALREKIDEINLEFPDKNS